MRLVFVTQRIDPEDPVLGATVAKVRALAARCDEVVVLADGAVPGALPANCRVRLFASPTRAGRGVRFATALASELRRSPRPAAVIAHMCPIYAVLAAPLVKPLRVRSVLWFTHWKRTRTLVAAIRLSDAVASVDVRSVPVASGKVRAIGHGIDVDEFTCAGTAGETGSLTALALGRYSAAKGLDVVLRAVAIARERGTDVRLLCHGTTGTEAEEADRAALETLVRELGLADVVTLGGPVSRVEVPSLLRRVDLLVNNMRPGAPDKVVFEAAACCRPVVVSNPPFDVLVGDLEPRLRFTPDDPQDLAGRLEAVAGLGSEARLAIGRTLRARVETSHSVDSWAAAMIAICQGPRARP